MPNDIMWEKVSKNVFLFCYSPSALNEWIITPVVSWSLREHLPAGVRGVWSVNRCRVPWFLAWHYSFYVTWHRFCEQDTKYFVFPSLWHQQSPMPGILLCCGTLEIIKFVSLVRRTLSCLLDASLYANICIIYAANVKLPASDSSPSLTTRSALSSSIACIEN